MLGCLLFFLPEEGEGRTKVFRSLAVGLLTARSSRGRNNVPTINRSTMVNPPSLLMLKVAQKVFYYPPVAAGKLIVSDSTTGSLVRVSFRPHAAKKS